MVDTRQLGIYVAFPASVTLRTEVDCPAPRVQAMKDQATPEYQKRAMDDQPPQLTLMLQTHVSVALDGIGIVLSGSPEERIREWQDFRDNWYIGDLTYVLESNP